MDVGNLGLAGLGGGAASSLGLPLLPSAMQYFGQQQTNQTNRDIASEANQASQASANQSMAFSHSEAQAQMAFQREMSNSAHQREVEDLKKAGLNPILSANAGSSTPSGAMGTGAMADIKAAPYTSPLQPAATAMLQTAQAASSIIGTLSEARLSNARMANLNAQTKNYASSSGLSQAQTANINADTRIKQPEASLMNNIQEMLQSAASTRKQQEREQSAPIYKQDPNWGTTGKGLHLWRP